MEARRQTLRFTSSRLSILCWLVFGASQVLGQGVEFAEYKLKLAFLYNFARFVEWPTDAFAGSSAPLTLCIAGDDPFQGEPEADLRGRTVAGHPIEIKRLPAADNTRACHLMFVPAEAARASKKIIAASRGSSTLTVGEVPGFAEQGGIINFVRKEDHLSFEINIGAAGQNGLKISSKLLALGKIVR